MLFWLFKVSKSNELLKPTLVKSRLEEAYANIRGVVDRKQSEILVNANVLVSLLDVAFARKNKLVNIAYGIVT